MSRSQLIREFSRLYNGIPTNAFTSDTGNLMGYGYVTFSSVEEAKSAFEIMKGLYEGQQPLQVEYASPQQAFEAGGEDAGRCEDGHCKRDVESEEEKEQDREEKSVRGSVY